ncbi:MAG: transporter [Moraxellaceae bacterium]|nr:MAG: transporter [Moraxellaceae bacterium]
MSKQRLLKHLVLNTMALNQLILNQMILDKTILNKTMMAVTMLAALGLSTLAQADDALEPGFDRPSIGFSTNIMPVASVAWEQGLPDFSLSKSKVAGQHVRQTSYQADTLIRTGLTPQLELQLGWDGPSWSRTSGAGQSQQQSGYGDTSVGIKALLPLASQTWSLALLAATSLITGDAEFGDDKRTVSLGSTANYAFNDQYSAALYANVDRYDAENSWAVSPSFSAALSPNTSGFVEYGYRKDNGESQQSVLGGGLTWMVHPRVQLDVSADFGLNAAAPEVQGGFGVSVMFP